MHTTHVRLFRLPSKKAKPHLCKACRGAAVKFCPETVRGSRHGKCHEFLLKYCCSSFLRKRSPKVPGIFHDKFHAIFHQTLGSCKCPISWRFSFCRRLPLKNLVTSTAAHELLVPWTHPAQSNPGYITAMDSDSEPIRRGRHPRPALRSPPRHRILVTHTIAITNR